MPIRDERRLEWERFEGEMVVAEAWGLMVKTTMVWDAVRATDFLSL